MTLAPASTPVPAARFTAVIADDEAPLRDFLRKRLALAWPELVVIGEARHGVEAARMIAELALDVAFLDIKMPGLTGLEVAQGIENDTRVVFVTAYDEFALEAFERAAVDYLVKPVANDRLARTVERLRRSIGSASMPADAASGASGDRTGDPAVGSAADAVPGEDLARPDLAGLLETLLRQQLGPGVDAAGAAAAPLRWIRASRGDTTFHVPVAEIRYVQSDDKYTVVHAGDCEHLIRTPLGELAAQLDPECFWQIHRSTLVNMDWVAGTRRDDGCCCSTWHTRSSLSRQLKPLTFQKPGPRALTGYPSSSSGSCHSGGRLSSCQCLPSRADSRLAMPGIVH